MRYGESIEESCLPINIVHQINEHNHWHDSHVNLSPQLLLDLELLLGERSKVHDFITRHAGFIAENVMVEDDPVYMIELLVAHVGVVYDTSGKYGTEAREREQDERSRNDEEEGHPCPL